MKTYDAAWEAYLGSLDAALSLMEVVLPDHTWGRAPNGQMWVRTLGGPFVWGGDDHPPARGLLLAVLRAMLADVAQETEVWEHVWLLQSQFF